MSGADFIWGGVLALGAAVEAWTLKSSKEGDTLSERLRAWFHVDTKTGKVVFSIGWIAFSTWLLFHIVG